MHAIVADRNAVRFISRMNSIVLEWQQMLRCSKESLAVLRS